MAAREQEGGDGGEDNMSAGEKADKDWGSIAHCFFCFMTEAKGGAGRMREDLFFVLSPLSPLPREGKHRK